MTRNIDAEVASRAAAFPHVTPFGNPMCGSPLGTAPSVDTPCELRSKIQLTAIRPTTATRPPGITFTQRLKTTRIASTESETANVAHEICPSSVSVSQNLTRLP